MVRPPTRDLFEIMTDWFRQNQKFDIDASAPTKISKKMMEKFTRNGLIQLVTKIDKKKFDRRSITWTREQIEEMVLKDVDKVEEYSGQGRAMFRAMQKFEVNGKIGLIFGSSKTPWIEAFGLQEGARKLIRAGPVNITIENYRYVRYVNPLEMALQYREYMNTFDFAASFSIEDLGFGKVDALNPDSDILEIQKTRCLLKDNGLLLLGIPVGWDTIVWNSHRIYGRIRFGLLTAGALFAPFGKYRRLGWDVVTMFHNDKEIPIDFEPFEEESDKQKWIVVVLRKSSTEAAIT